MNKITIYYNIENDGCGAAVIRYFLTKQEGFEYESNLEPEYLFPDDCSGMIETYEGSNIHLEAIEFKKQREEYE